MDQSSKQQQIRLEQQIHINQKVLDYDYQLQSLCEMIEGKDQEGAIQLTFQLKKEFDLNLLEKIYHDQRFKKETIRSINQALNQLDDSLLSNTLRVVLSDHRIEFRLRDELEQIGKKVLEDMNDQKFKYGQYLLNTFFNVTYQWQRALFQQEFDELPLCFIEKLLDEDDSFKFLMKCINDHCGCIFNERVGQIIWLGIGSGDIKNDIVYQNYQWMIDLSTKNLKYLEYFIKKGMFCKLVKSFYSTELIDGAFFELITKFICQLLTYDQHNIMIMNPMNGDKQSKYQRELIIFEMQRFFLIAYGQMIQNEWLGKQFNLSDKEYHYLLQLKCILYDHYYEQLINALPFSNWYEQILFRLLSQNEFSRINKIALDEAKKWKNSQHWKHFRDYFENHKALLDDETIKILNIQ